MDGGLMSDRQLLALDSCSVFGGVSKGISSEAAELPGGSGKPARQACFSAPAVGTGVTSLLHSWLFYCPALPDNEKETHGEFHLAQH